ncbi:hypothetical protein K438DRAFT_2020970, partial [Mycena galopus ATCC 62051]
MDRKHVVIALLHQCTDNDVKSYKKWLRLSPELARNPAYNASNAVEWISPDKYNDFLMYKERAAAENTLPNDTIELSDTESRPIKHELPTGVHEKPFPLHDVINLCDSDSETDATPIKREAKPAVVAPAKQHRKTCAPKKINVTRSEKVDRVVEVTGSLERWPAADPDVDIAYVVDFSQDPRAQQLIKGPKVKGLDSLLKLRDGGIVTGLMVEHACPAVKIVYTSKDPAVLKCVVIFRGRHSHPPWPMEKLAAGQWRMQRARTTEAIIGTSLDVKYPAFRDSRRLRTEVLKFKAEENPAGLFWAGLVHEYESDLKRPVAERYIHQIRMDGAMKLAVAMNPELAVLLHDPGVRYIVGDITFKRTKGEFNEWEAVIWYAETFERLTVVRIYINMATTEAFVHLFDAFFTTVKQVTGKSVRFKVFYEKGNIYSIHFDMEAAQVQGLGVALSKMVLNDSDLLLRFPDHTPDNIVQYILKLCSVHFERSSDALVAVVGQEVVNYLNNFRGLSDPTDIENWHNFCRTHENKKLRDGMHTKFSTLGCCLDSMRVYLAFHRDTGSNHPTIQISSKVLTL